MSLVGPRPTRASLIEDRGERIAVVEPEGGAPRAQVLCVHGLTDHLGRQLNVGRWLASQGYRAVSFELVGHGGRESDWADSRWVYDAYLASDDPARIRSTLEADHRRFGSSLRAISRRRYQALGWARASDHLAQVERMLEFSRGLDPRLPIFLLGHSMGALLCLETLWRRGDRAGELRGVVLLSPALRPQGRPGNLLEGLLIDFVWGLRRAPFSFTRTAVKTALDFNLPVGTAWGNAWISDLRDEVALFSSDPLIPELLPTRYASSVEGLMVGASQRGSRLPVEGLLMLPEQDGITSVSAGLSFARSVQAALGGRRFQYEQFRGLRAHDLMRSSAREAARFRIAGWLDERVGADRSSPSPGRARRDLGLSWRGGAR
jgi:alpha-beta hydrolase superfamily lysophospholipase